ncbi:MAG: hypothetical protein HY867_13260 [Chloroflexi bacterium]|nr:hypothetical protein [Chloroflexota bacterium]
MKKIAMIGLLVLSLVLSGCASRKANAQTDGSVSPDGVSGPEVATTLPESGGGPIEPLPANGGAAAIIKFEDNGRTFTYKVGDSFLLNLGAGIYDWEVTIDQQSVISLKMGVEVIDGVQGTFEALKTGTALLTAIGNPKCLKSNPPCMMPTVLFKVTLIVE